MNPLVVITFLAAACSAAPSGTLLAAAPYGAAIAAPAVAAIPAPAPYSTSAVVGAPITTIHQAPAQISKQVHLGQTTYVSGYATEVLKPAIPDLNIAVPTALRGSTQVNPAIVTVQKETHVVNEPYEVPRPYDVPYDVIKPVEQIVEVPTPVHVAKPVPYAVPTPVAGEPIIQRVQGAPIVRHNHIEAVAAPAFAAAAPYGIAAAAY
jgi:hypothetical protein